MGLGDARMKAGLILASSLRRDLTLQGKDMIGMFIGHCLVSDNELDDSGGISSRMCHLFYL